MEFLNESQLLEKWAPVLDAPDVAAITDPHRRKVTAVVLENTQRSLNAQRAELNEATVTTATQGYSDTVGLAKYDPVLISLVRRAVPQMIAYDICGVQPMQQPTGLIFALRSRYTNQSGAEALFNEADSDFSGTGTQSGTLPTASGYSTGTGVTTQVAETRGDGTGPAFGEMSFTVEKISVEAKSRALKAGYTMEFAQDLKALHGLDADAELSNILSRELLAEVNREVLRTMYIAAAPGARSTATPGTFDCDVDSNGRWSGEKFKGLLFQLDREANAIAQTTRMGKGNFIVVSSDVASALAMAGVLDYSPALQTANLNVDEATTTFAGVLMGKLKVYVDPFSGQADTNQQFYMVGRKGASAWEAGMYYCPYIPLQLVRTIDPETFTPKMAYRMRYGIVQNPFYSLANGQNTYYRKAAVTNLL